MLWLLFVPPHQATQGSWPYYRGGFHAQAYPGEAALPPPEVSAAPSCCAVVGAVACPARNPWQCQGSTRRFTSYLFPLTSSLSVPLPYIQQPRKCGNVLGHFQPKAPLCKGSWQPVGLTEGLSVSGDRGGQGHLPHQSLRHRLRRRHLPLHKGGFESGRHRKSDRR